MPDKQQDNSPDESIEGYLALATAMIEDAVGVYHKNRYPPNVSTDMASPRLEALTFLHGPLFESLVDLGWGKHAGAVREAHGIPQPGPDCVCEWCRTDYSPEAEVVSDDFTRFRFSPGKKHHVFWARGEISHVMPHSAAYDSTFNARLYLKQLKQQVPTEEENNE